MDPISKSEDSESKWWWGCEVWSYKTTLKWYRINGGSYQNAVDIFLFFFSGYLNNNFLKKNTYPTARYLFKKNENLCSHKNRYMDA